MHLQIRSRLATSPAGRFARDNRANSAVEFALILPVLVIIYILGFDVTLAVTADRRVTNIASTVGDLVSQATQISNDEIADIFEASAAIIAPMDEASLSIVVTSVVADEDGVTTVDWSDAFNGSAAAEGSPATVPEGILAPLESVIVSTVSYSYSSPLAQFISAEPWTFTEVYYLRPRRAALVARTS